MILTVIGGTAHSTPVLIEALSRVCPQARLTVRLAGRDPDRLHSVERACKLLAAGTNIEIEAYTEAQFNAAISGSDIVLVQARIDGYAGRAFDESFSLPYGIPGDEGLGPGGLSAAYRSWPRMHDLLLQVRSAAPDALVILLSSPGSLLIRLAALTVPGWPVWGTCELPFTTLRHICSVTGADATKVRFTYTGVNHLGFLSDVRADAEANSTVGEAIHTEDLIARYVGQQHNDVFPSSALVARFGGFPLKYLRLHFEPERVVADQLQRSVARADELSGLAQHAFGVFREGDTESIRQVLLARRADWYEFAILPLLLARLGQPVTEPMFLSIADRNGDVRERAYAFRDGTLDPLPASGPASDAIEALVDAFSAYEGAAARAVVDGSVDALANALALHPSFSAQHARSLATAIVNQPFSRHHDGPRTGAIQENQLCRI